MSEVNLFLLLHNFSVRTCLAVAYNNIGTQSERVPAPSGDETDALRQPDRQDRPGRLRRAHQVSDQ